MAAHRYWRIQVITSGSYSSIGEIQLRDVIGGANRIGSGTPSANSAYSGTYPVTAAVDGNVATDWCSAGNDTTPNWWQYDFGAGNAFDIVQVAITATTSGDASYTPTDFALAYSDNGTSWTAFYRFTTGAWSAAQTRTFSSTIAVNTSWNPGDVAGSPTLSNGNLTASLSFSASGVRSVFGTNTGKFYFEIRANAWGANVAVGLGTAAASLQFSGLGGAAGAVVLLDGGNVNVDGSGTSVNFGARAAGDVVCIAVDLTAQLVWFRIGAAGNWNANAGFAPGGTGGASFSAVGGAGGTALYAMVSGYGGGSNWTANFGDSAFIGAVPAGFSSGFPGVASTPAASATQARAWVMA